MALIPLAIAERDKAGHWDLRQILPRSPFGPDEFRAGDWKGLSIGVAFNGDRGIYVSGRRFRLRCPFSIRTTSSAACIVSINQGGFSEQLHRRFGI